MQHNGLIASTALSCLIYMMAALAAVSSGRPNADSTFPCADLADRWTEWTPPSGSRLQHRTTMQAALSRAVALGGRVLPLVQGPSSRVRTGRHHVARSASRRRGGLRVSAVAEAERTFDGSAGAAASVTIDNSADPSCTVLVVEGRNRPGEFAFDGGGEAGSSQFSMRGVGCLFAVVSSKP